MNYEDITKSNIDWLIQNCSSSSALAMDTLQYWITPSIYFFMFGANNHHILQNYNYKLGEVM